MGPVFSVVIPSNKRVETLYSHSEQAELAAHERVLSLHGQTRTGASFAVGKKNRYRCVSIYR
jgi:hypothetical protein